MGLMANCFRYQFGGMAEASAHALLPGNWNSDHQWQKWVKPDDLATAVRAGAANPVGHTLPRCWNGPIKLGEMSMRTGGTGDLTAALVSSRTMSIDMTGSGDLTAAAGLVISMAIAMSGSGSLSAAISGYMNMSCDLSGTGDLDADLRGIASMAVDMLGAGDLEATIAAYGNMSIDIVVTGTGLTTANVGDAIWRYLIGGTEAQSLLSTAGSGGVDYDTLWASMPTALKESLAAYVLAAAQAAPIDSNVKQVNDITIAGAGVPPTFDSSGTMTDPGDPWVPA